MTEKGRRWQINRPAGGGWSLKQAGRRPGSTEGQNSRLLPLRAPRGLPRYCRSKWLTPGSPSQTFFRRPGRQGAIGHLRRECGGRGARSPRRRARRVRNPSGPSCPTPISGGLRSWAAGCSAEEVAEHALLLHSFGGEGIGRFSAAGFGPQSVNAGAGRR